MLTAKQKAFIEAYTGNATEAAKFAGYSEATAYSIGQRLLKQPEVASAIQAREAERTSDEVANREARLKFWTSVMYDVTHSIRDRLRASELLAKAEGDFLDRVEVESQNNLDLTAQVRLYLLEREKERRDAALQAGEA